MERPERLSLQSADGAQLNLDALYQIAPSCFTEATDSKTGKIKRVVNFDVLRQLLGDDTVEDATEAYEFSWVGKQEARAEVLRPINKTLRPVKEDSVDWDNTQNLYIEGDNLEVLKLLQKSYLGKVKMIYIDPPYNTGNDFVYHDDSSRSQEEEDLAAGNIDELGNRYRKNTDSNGRFHSEWCSMIYARLMVARSLLTEDGVIFISIDDNEDGNLLKICNEVFGSENFIGQLIHQRAKGGGQAKHIVKGHDYILVYSSNSDVLNLARKKVIQKKVETINGVDYIINDDVVRKVFGKYDKSMGDRRCFYEELLQYKGEAKKKEIDEDIKNGKLFLRLNDSGMHTICRYEKVGEATSKMYSIIKLTEDQSVIKVLSEEGKKDIEGLGIKGFSYPKPVDIIRQIVDAGTNKDSLVLDFFSGSATTAHAIMKLNGEDGGQRKYIMVQLPEETPEDSDARKEGFNNICELGKERIRRAGKKIKEEHPNAKDLDTGFRVFRIDESNFEDVERTPKDYNQDELDLFLNNVKSDRDDLDLLFGCMLDWGVKLSLPMSSEEVDGKMIYTVNEGDLVACFAEKVTDSVVKAMADKQPLRVIFRDSCFDQDADKINIYETFKQLLDWSDKDVEKNIRVI
ncbi:site-specific DNA-methyltransferase [Segatella bryantii]|uniref:site-specific DNA-methyltransferase (adenine-specific) n=1 Tax=Segatella bryantii TaxID=77095 RepID=A0ABX4EIM1_SEGBR|nr:site-specific DNA-methyltransferase [Segatella bryantii]OYP56006.1 site-specific DNA-methyltransferase [Segatella bryantii]UKK81938.1 site-specific DNA-methyltransferase [Segatella bryantii]